MSSKTRGDFNQCAVRTCVVSGQKTAFRFDGRPDKLLEMQNWRTAPFRPKKHQKVSGQKFDKLAASDRWGPFNTALNIT